MLGSNSTRQIFIKLKLEFTKILTNEYDKGRIDSDRLQP